MADEPRPPKRAPYVFDPMSVDAKYYPACVEQAKVASRMGATDADLAELFGVSVNTIFQWRCIHKEFADACKVGKAAADNRVEQALYHRAIGYAHDAVKILQHEGEPVLVPYTEHYPPDTVACIFWLRNRKRKQWTSNPTPDDGGDDAPITKVMLHVVDGRAAQPQKPAVPPLPEEIDS